MRLTCPSLSMSKSNSNAPRGSSYQQPRNVERALSHDSSASSVPPPPPPVRDVYADDDSTNSTPPPPPPLDDVSLDSSRRPLRRISDLCTPAFVINRHAFARNCRLVSESAKERKLRLRPHIKTHKTVEGAWVQAHGLPFDDEEGFEGAKITGFVASTVPEVKMMVQAAYNFGGPFKDILYGVPVGESKLEALNRMRLMLQEKVGTLHILMDHPHQVEFVEKFLATQSNPNPWSVFLKLDTGYHRAGITCDERGVELAEKIINSLYLKLHGVYSHCGHAYDANAPDQLERISKTDLSTIDVFLISLQMHMESKGAELFSMDDLVVSVGSTPSLFHHVNNCGLRNVEIHPGNYTLYDRQQLWTGACPDESHIAGRVIARVVGHYPDRNTILLDAGATALSKDTTEQGGCCAIHGFPELECYSMSQEVTLVRPVDKTQAMPFEELPLGHLVNLLPNHSCLAAACFDKFHVIDDASCLFSPDELVVEEWSPARGFAVDA